jgi:ribosomal protein S7
MGLNADLACLSDLDLARIIRLAGVALQQSTERQNWKRHDEAIRFLMQCEMEFRLREATAAERRANQLSLLEEEA